MIHFESCIFRIYNTYQALSINPSESSRFAWVEIVRTSVYQQLYRYVVKENGLHVESKDVNNFNEANRIADLRVRKYIGLYEEVFTKFAILPEFFNQNKIMNCDIALRFQKRTVGLSYENVLNYVITLKREYYNEELDLNNKTVYVIDRDEDFSDFLGKQINEINTNINENVLLLVYNENATNEKYKVFEVYNSKIVDTIFNDSNNYTGYVIVKVFQLMVIDEVSDIVKYGDYSIEGQIILRNLDNEIIKR